jgi:nucleoside 2-deoxyribosyltransferase
MNMESNMKVSEEFRQAIDKPEGNIKAYLCAGWFSPNKMKALNMLEDVLHSFDELELFDPRFDSPQIGKNPTEAERQANFDANLSAMRSSDVLIASTEGLDSGTIWECGYGSALGIPTFGFAPLLPEGVPFNLMLAQSMKHIFLSSEALTSYLKDGKEPERIGAC